MRRIAWSYTSTECSDVLEESRSYVCSAYLDLKTYRSDSE